MDGPPPPEENFDKMPLEERLASSVWKARKSGYETAKKLVGETEEEQVFNDLRDRVPAFVVDKNIPAQLAGLEAALAFVENAPE